MSKSKKAVFKKVIARDGICIQPRNGAFDPFSTLCGDCDTGFNYVETDKEVDCFTCKNTYEVIKNGVVLEGKI